MVYWWTGECKTFHSGALSTFLCVEAFSYFVNRKRRLEILGFVKSFSGKLVFRLERGGVRLTSSTFELVKDVNGKFGSLIRTVKRFVY